MKTIKLSEVKSSLLSSLALLHRIETIGRPLTFEESEFVSDSYRQLAIDYCLATTIANPSEAMKYRWSVLSIYHGLASYAGSLGLKR